MLLSQGHQDYYVDMVGIVGVALLEAQVRSFHFQKNDAFTDFDKIAQICGGIEVFKMLQLVHAPCWQRRTWGGMLPADPCKKKSTSGFVAWAIASNSNVGAPCQPLY